MNIPVQIFSLVDFPIILILLFIEIIFSADNVSVLALIINKLPSKNRRQALFYGLASGLILRGVIIVFVSYVIDILFIQIIGGLYLMYLAIEHSIKFRKKIESQKNTITFWKCVFLVEITDILFAIDSILAAFAIILIYYPLNMIKYKLWMIYVGGALTIIIMRFMANTFIKLINNCPKCEQVIFVIVGWIGLKLIVEGSSMFFVNEHLQYIIDFVFWIGIMLIVLIAFCVNFKKRIE